MKVAILLLSLAGSGAFGQAFLRQQLAMPRVKAAFAEKDSMLEALSKAKGLPYPPRQLYLRAFKEDALLEVWSQTAKTDSFVLLTTYPICAASGSIGPKIQQGDMQVPEGAYYIDRFNPQSSFHLSLGISYPNTVDRARSAGKPSGGDIFVHGNCVTIGCLPLTDDKIEEVYTLAVRAKASGQQKIPIHIFPARLQKATFDKLVKANATHTGLWTSLKSIYDKFEASRRLPHVIETRNGYEVR